ncbi:hypothetical protein VPHK24_0002 [Vibrio phage K24]
MTTYNTYQEAKIANPEESIYATKISMNGKREVFGVYDIIADITLNYYTCNPADHCITVEEFLSRGHKLIKGDVYLDYDGEVVEFICVCDNSQSNTNRKENDVRYILRAAALEKKPTPTKFVKVEESIFDLKGEFERGELFTKLGDTYIPLSDCEKAFASSLLASSIYRQVEIDWRNEVNNYFLKTKVLGIDCTIEESIETDFYNDEFISLCHLVASLTEKPEGV